MSDIPRMKKAAYDKPENYALPGQLEDVYAVIDEALDNGELSLRTLERAKEMGRKTLEAYSNYKMPWTVYSETAPSVRIDGRSGIEKATKAKVSNIYGEINDIDVVNDIDGSRMLAVKVESTGIGQYERCIIPLARQGDIIILKERPVDMPVPIRGPLKSRAKKHEVSKMHQFDKFLSDGVKSGEELRELLRSRAKLESKKSFEKYMVAINLGIEECYSIGEPYGVTVIDGRMKVIYDQASLDSTPRNDYVQDESFFLIGIKCTADYEADILQDITLIVESSECDAVAEVPLNTAMVILESDEYGDHT
jgi:hypothetical protein